MKEVQWEKLVEREGDFLKNYLMYESFENNFKKVFDFNHGNHLTIRKGNVFTHYFDRESSEEVSLFVLNKIKRDPNFIKDIVKIGKEKFEDLIRLYSELKNLENLPNEEIAKLARKYFDLYKEPYSYFNFTIFTNALEKEDSDTAKQAIELMTEMRFFGRESFNKAHELATPLFKEISKRLNLSVDEVKFLTPQEIEMSLVDLKEKIKKRANCYFLHKNGKSELKENEIYKIEENSLTQEIKGRGTFPAVYRGKVKLISSREDIRNIEFGDIIVSRMTTPDLIIKGIEKAGAIITDEGGVTCHAANLSREFNIPCIVGTKIATKVLKDGDIVEIDAEKGIVKKI